jgi:hypothetical protein
MALKTMSIDKLRDMQSKIEAALSRKVTERRRELESELLKLAGFAGGGKAKSARGGRMGRPLDLFLRLAATCRSGFSARSSQRAAASCLRNSASSITLSFGFRSSVVLS